MSDAQTTPETTDPLLRELLALLRGGQAHAGFDKAVANFPQDRRGVVPAGLPYSAWQIVEHMRIAQRDILDFSAPPTGGYQALEWPAQYWPGEAAPPDARAWERTSAAIAQDRRTFEALLLAPGVDLYKPFRWGQGQNLLREALLIADHTAYHTGELIVVRRLMGVWKPA